MSDLDPAFLDLPFRQLGEAALTKARDLGVTYADFRFERIKSQGVHIRDLAVDSMATTQTLAYAVRVIHRGAWGFASGTTFTAAAASATANAAVEVASALASLNREPVELAPEPVYQDSYVSSYEIDPFSVPDDEKVAFFLEVNKKVLSSGKVDHVDFGASLVLENKYFAGLDGTSTPSRESGCRVRSTPPRSILLRRLRDHAHLRPPRGRGWEHFRSGFDYLAEAERIPELLEEKMRAPSVEPGRYDLVIHPSNLWLTIHESIGHATELDRALGYEANYAGTSFATLDKLNKLKYGLRHARHRGPQRGERSVDGRLRRRRRGRAAVGHHAGRHSGRLPAQPADGDQAGVRTIQRLRVRRLAAHVPIQRMPNVSLQPAGRTSGSTT